MRFCSYCGKEIHEQAVMCVHCGKSLGNAVPQQTESNTKFCPVCGNECIKDAVICVKCGQPFQVQSVAQKKPAAQKKVKQKGDVLRIIAIVYFAIQTVIAVVYLINGMIEGYRTERLFIRLLDIVPYVLILLGMIKLKKNPLPGIGYISSILIAILSFIIYDTTPAVSAVVVWVAYILLAGMFLKKGFLKKLWFLPAIGDGLAFAISMITRLANDYYVYEHGYYYTYTEFMWDSFFIDLVINIFSLAAIILVCYIAKEMWAEDVLPAVAAGAPMASVQSYASPVNTAPVVPVAPVVAPVQSDVVSAAVPVQPYVAPVEAPTAPAEAPAVFTETPAEPVAPVETPEAPVAETVAPIEMPTEPVDTTVEQPAE